MLALGGVRTAAFDELLGSVDLAVAAVPATAPGSLAWLAVAGLGAVAPRALQAIAPAPGPARALALAGVLAAPGLRTSVAAAAEAIAR